MSINSFLCSEGHLPLGPLWEEEKERKSLKWRKGKREKKIRRRRRRCSGRGNDEE